MTTKRLRKDLIIPAGTVFDTAPYMTRRHGDGHIECTVSLSDNTCGFFVYDISDDPEIMAEWFEDVPTEYAHEATVWLKSGGPPMKVVSGNSVVTDVTYLGDRKKRFPTGAITDIEPRENSA